MYREVYLELKKRHFLYVPLKKDIFFMYREVYLEFKKYIFFMYREVYLEFKKYIFFMYRQKKIFSSCTVKFI
jgi:hypothetical protein